MRGAVLLLLALCASCAAPAPAPAPTPGGTASSSPRLGLEVFPLSQRTAPPALSGTTISGQHLRLADQVGRGRPVAINVWASWCGPCRSEIPLLARASRTTLRVIGIDERDDPRRARAFATARGVSYPSLSDPDGKLLAQLPMLPRTGVPSTLFLDRRGRVVARVVGPLDGTVLQQIVREFGATR